MEEMEEEDCCNRETRFAVERSDAIAAGNDVFDLKAFEQWLSSDLGSIGEIVEAAYYNALGS